MAYVSTVTKYVEINTECPMVVRLPKEALGLSNWSMALLNIDNGQINPISQFVVNEIGDFVVRTALNGDHPSGTSKLKVIDSSNITVGMSIRLENIVCQVLAVEPASHLLTLDRVTSRSFVDNTQIKEVLFPDYLGVYRFEFIPTVLGNFLVSIIDNNGIVNPIEDDITVLATLKSANGTGKISALSRIEM